MTRWLAASVVLAPLAIAPAAMGTTLAQAKNAAFVLLACLLVGARSPSPWIRAFMALAALSSLFAGLPAWSVLGCAGIAGFLLVLQETAQRSDAEWAVIRRAIAAAALVQILWMGLQSFGLDPLFQAQYVNTDGVVVKSSAPPVGWFGNPSDSALFVALSLPALMSITPWLLVPAGLALVALRSTVGIAGLVVVLVWLSAQARSVIATALVTVAVLIGAALYVIEVDPMGLGVRPAGWAVAITVASAKPGIGWGPNAVDSPRVQIVYGPTNERWNHFFSEWLQGAVELGVIGPLLAAGYLASLARRLRGRWSACGEALPAAAVLLLLSLVSIPLRVGPAALLCALWIGRLEAVAMRPATEVA